MQVIDSARRGEVSLINNGTGVCNTIYVDDVCDAIRAALTTEKALGQAFFITDDRAATWSEFILTFARMVEPPPSVRELTSQEILNHWAAQQPTLKSNLRGAGRLAVSSEFQKQLATVPAIGNSLRFTKRALRKLLTDDQALRLKQMARPSAAAAPAPSFRWPNKNRVMRETFPIAFRNDHAKSLLGWQPAYDLQRGAALTRTWLAFARMLQPYPAR
jgi:nucleoside-diphosphate-sugar epimerase